MKSVLLTFFLVCLVSMSACDGISRSSGSSGGVYPQEQKERAKVIEEFERDPASATEKYKNMWREEIEKEESTYANSVIAMTVAGQLMVHDEANYRRYHDYILARAKSGNVDVAAASMSALSRAKGQASINVLVEHVNDPRSIVAREAMTAINYRLATSMYDEDLSADRSYLSSLLPQLCKSKYSGEIRQFCGDGK